MNHVNIKRIVPADAEAIFAIVERNRDHLKNLKWVESATLETVRQYLIAANHDEIIRAITYDGTIVGLITLRDGGDHHEIGYWLDHDYCNRGVMAHAVSLICQLVTVPVFATIRQVNIRSRKVLLKNRFVHLYSEGEWDTYRKA